MLCDVPCDECMAMHLVMHHATFYLFARYDLPAVDHLVNQSELQNR